MSFSQSKQYLENVRRVIVIHSDSENSCYKDKDNLSKRDNGVPGVGIGFGRVPQPSRSVQELDGSLSDSSSSLEGYIEALGKITEPTGYTRQLDRAEKESRDNVFHETTDGRKSSWAYDHNRNENLLDSARNSGVQFPDFRIPNSLYNQLYDFQ